LKENIIKTKSFDFAVAIVSIYKQLTEERKEFVISKQLLRSGTSIGAMVRESEHAESKADFIHKLSIAQKEANEVLYWLELLNAKEFMTISKFQKTHSEAKEIIRLITAILKTAKRNNLKSTTL